MHRYHAVTLEQRLVRRIVTGNGTRVALRESRALWSPSGFEDDDGDTEFGRALQRSDKGAGIPDCFEENRDDLCRRLLQRVVHVIGDGRYELMAG